MEDQLEILNIPKTVDNSKILRQSIIDYVVNKALNSDFKKQLDLSLDEKRKIVEDTLNDCKLKFLYSFGEYLIEEHLEYFKSDNNYEINFHLHRLRRLINSKKVICKNRRYQAMLELLKGDYFSDNEMRNREPLLWEQLVGQYLSEEDKFNYDNQYVAQNSLTEVLFEQIDRDNREDLKRQQQLDEFHQPNEFDDDSDDNNDNNSDALHMAMEVNKPSGFWGEYSKPKNQTVKIGKRRWKEDHFINIEQYNTKELSVDERDLLLNEFKSHMIQKFLSGQEDFNYSDVDNNPEYDNLQIKAIDDEDKYFDSESPIEEILVENYIEEVPTIDNGIEEDELDIYMNMLKKNELTDGVTDKLKKL